MSHIGDRVDRFTQVIKEKALEALLVTTKENVYYISGYYGLGQWSTAPAKAWALLMKDGSVHLMVPSSETDYLAMVDFSAASVIPCGQFHYVWGENNGSEGESRKMERVLNDTDGVEISDLQTALKRGLDRQGLRRGTLGVDEDALSLEGYHGIRQIWPGEIEHCSAALLHCRMQKMPDEIDALRRGVAATEQGYLNALSALRDGITEIELASIVEKTLVESGSWPETTVVGSGERSAFPNALPTNRRIRPGDILRFDIGGVLDQYHSDISRCVFVDSATDRQNAYQAALLTGHEAALEMIRPGVRADQVFEVITAAVHGAGMKHFKRHHCGHGIGLHVYEMPMISPADDTVLREGMVLCVEVPYYEVGFGGLQIEDAILITASGCEPLTTLKRRFDVIPLTRGGKSMPAPW